MSFDFSTLVTDRAQADVSRVKQIAEKIKNGTASESELAEFNSAAMKGAYNYTDLNRVTAAMEALKAKLEGYGYAVPGYQRIVVPHVIPESEPTSKLPEGYLELTYIESTGTQYVDTGFMPNQDTRVVIDFELLQVTSTVTTIFGQRNNTAETDPLFYVFHVLKSGQTVRSDYFGTGASAILNLVGQRVVVDKNKNVCTVGETVLTNTPATGQGVHTLYLFGLNDRGAKLSFPAVAKLYSCQIYDNGTLVRNFVPCINPNGEVGLYDTATKAFFGNAGTGAFISGARVGITLPEEYTRVDYIESTGTQYINTGISVPHASCKIAVKFKTRNILDRPPITGYAYTTWNWSVNMMFPYQNVFYANGGTTGIAFAANTLYNAEYTSTYVTVNGTTVQKSIANTVDGYNNTIFYGSTRYGAHLLYEYRLYNDGTLVRDMIPVVRKQDEEAGLYDLVNGMFYKNAGTGTFTTGNVIQSPSQPIVIDPYTWYEFDWPTPEAMTMYLLNVAAIRTVLSVLQSTPRVPLDMEKLMVQEANDIEQIVLDVYRQITIMPTTFIACGEALCGGDNL